MLYFSRLKTWMIVGICLVGAILCVPNFWPRDAMPSWMPWRQIQLGLDLKGGSYLLMEVDMDTALRERLESLADSARQALRRQPLVGYTAVAARPAQRQVLIRLRDPSQAQEAMTRLRELANPVTTGIGTSLPDLDVAATADGQITMTLSEVGLREKATSAIQQSIEIIRRRIDGTGVSEPVIARQGTSRILVQLPGVEDPARIKQLLGTTARMTFRLLDESAVPQAGQPPPPGVEFLRGEGRDADTVFPIRRRIEVDGANLTDARAGQNPQTGEWVVNFHFDSVGARRFAEVTRNNVGKPFAIVLDDRVISAPNIREPITGGSGQISGSFTAASATDLAVLLRAGALPAPLTVVEERTVGPDLGADAIRAGIIACVVGLVLVCAYMLTVYKLFGAFASIAVIVNLILALAFLSLLEATLTLPGIAGLLLSVGMSVDANILINERVWEETKRGRTPLSALEAGYTRAFATIVDSNLTALIKMALLYAFGTGPIRGFAVTVAFGIMTSMFTATMLVRLMTATWYRSRRPAALPV